MPSPSDVTVIVCTRDRGVATITMNRPERRNALSMEHIEELIDALRARAKSDARVVILAANGPVFCAGHDYDDAVRLGNVDIGQSGRVTAYQIVGEP